MTARSGSIAGDVFLPGIFISIGQERSNPLGPIGLQAIGEPAETFPPGM